MGILNEFREEELEGTGGDFDITSLVDLSIVYRWTGRLSRDNRNGRCRMTRRGEMFRGGRDGEDRESG